MNIVIFGANGATGKILTKQALDSGHRVTAVTRHPEAFPLRDVRLNVMGGDVFDLALVEQAVAGQDAVLSTLGVPFSRKPITIYSRGMANILQAIVMSTLGQTTYADMKQMETLLMKSELDWTVVRASGLFETPAVTDYQVAEDHIRGQFTSRADLADCMLQQLATDQYSRKVMAVATFSVQPSMMKFMLQEAFKEPSKS